MSLDAAAVDRAAALLETARRDLEPLAGLPDDARPRDLADAYAVAGRLVERLVDGGAVLAGWFCGCTNVEIQQLLGLDGPYAGRLFAHQVRASPALLRADELPPAVLECEVAFRLDADLPPRATPYGRDEVAAAVASVHPAIEVVAGNLQEWTRQDVFSVIADNGTDGALVLGPAAAWAPDRLAGLTVTLALDGEVVRRGSTSAVLGDPLEALVWLANAAAAAGTGLRSGDVANTGTATSICPVAPGQEAVADFGPLGAARLRLVAGA